MNYISNSIDFKSFLVTVLGDFIGFLGSDGLPGSPLKVLGLSNLKSWYMYHLRFEASNRIWGGFGLDFGVLGDPWGDIFHKTYDFFLTLFWVGFWAHFFMDFQRFLICCLVHVLQRFSQN